MDEAAAKRFEAWYAGFEQLAPDMKALVLTIYPTLIEEAKVSPQKSADRMEGTCAAFLRARGLMEVCPRCAGKGEYSYNLIHGRRCFKCGGSGDVFPRITKAFLQRVAEARDKMPPGTIKKAK